MARILYVEDNEDNAAMLRAWLELEGDLEVLVAANGAQGVALATRETPDLVLMDLYLPGMDGFEAARQIRAGTAAPRVPIIALSAHARDDERARARGGLRRVRNQADRDRPAAREDPQSARGVSDRRRDPALTRPRPAGTLPPGRESP